MDDNVAKNTVYDKSVNKVNAFDTKIQSTSGFFTKAKHDLEKPGHEKKIEDVNKIPNTSALVKKTGCNTKIRKIKNMISSVTSLVNTATLNTKAAEI